MRGNAIAFQLKFANFASETINTRIMEEKKAQEAANTQAEAKQEPKRTNKSWEAFGRSKGCFVINDPKFML